MTKEEIQAVKESAPVAFYNIKREFDCDDEEAAMILKDQQDVHSALESGDY